MGYGGSEAKKDGREESVLQVKDLEISFFQKGSEIRAVRGISYRLAQGEILGIVGESGSGKSVSSHAILGLNAQSSRIKNGQILFGGQDLLQASPAELRRIRGNEIAMVFQDPMTALDPLFSIGYHMEEALKRHTKLTAAQRRERILELLELVEISHPAQRLRQFPHELSGGMRQRVLIAMAISCNPRILIADEPTTALDVTVQAQILELFQRLRDQLGMSVILITHDFGVVSMVCDRVLVMYAGKIVEEGDSGQIFYRNAHPYTRGLLDAVVDPEAEKTQRLSTIPGDPPDLSSLPPGCAFAPRCHAAMNLCAREDAPLFETEAGHWAACWKVLSGAVTGG